MTRSTLTPDPALAPFEDSTSLVNDIPSLRQKAGEDGYLFFKQLIPGDAVAAVRRDLFSALEEEGVLSPVSGEEGLILRSKVDAIPAESLRLDIGVSKESYVAVQRSQKMHELPHHPALVGFYQRFFGEPVFVHPRHIVRCMSGHPSLRPTPPHQDFPLVQGSKNTWTAWFPLSDTPLSQGPLSVLRGSHRNGYVPITSVSGAGGIEAILCRDEDDWVGAGFEAGDVLTFPSLTVHRAVRATSKERIRLSMDVRFQPASEPIEARSLTNHSDASWADIYRNWDNSDLKYYWEASSPTISPWDDSFVQPGQRIC